MAKITTLPGGYVLVRQEYFDGEDMAVMERTFTVQGSYVYQVHANGTSSQVCEGLLPTGPTLMAGDDLADTIRKTLHLRGGARKGSGRPQAPARPAPISWRPETQEQRDAWLELGGPKWVRRLLDEYIAASKNRIGG